MEKYKAIPEGYMKVGELAKKMNVTVRTLQYYDKEGLLNPSSESDGGFRLYTDQDMVRLLQIQTMKELGFTLSEIKKRLVALDTPDDMVKALAEHEIAIKKKMEILSKSLKEIKALKAEVKQMRTMDFKRYADILANLQMKNELYWVIKHLDGDLLDHLREHFQDNKNRALYIIKSMNRLHSEAARLQKKGVAPESKRAQKIAKASFDLLLEVTNGDTNLMQKFEESVEKANLLGGDLSEDYMAVHDFHRAALDFYLKNREK